MVERLRAIGGGEHRDGSMGGAWLYAVIRQRRECSDVWIVSTAVDITTMFDCLFSTLPQEMLNGVSSVALSTDTV